MGNIRKILESVPANVPFRKYAIYNEDDDFVKRFTDDQIDEMIDFIKSNEDAITLYVSELSSQATGFGKTPKYETHLFWERDVDSFDKLEELRPVKESVTTSDLEESDLDEKIKQVDGKWEIWNKDGTKKLEGPFDTEDEAKKRLRAIEYFKHKNEAVELNKDFYDKLPSMACEYCDALIDKYGQEEWFSDAWNEYRDYVNKTSSMEVRMPGVVFKKYLEKSESVTDNLLTESTSLDNPYLEDALKLFDDPDVYAVLVSYRNSEKDPTEIEWLKPAKSDAEFRQLVNDVPKPHGIISSIFRSELHKYKSHSPIDIKALEFYVNNWNEGDNITVTADLLNVLEKALKMAKQYSLKESHGAVDDYLKKFKKNDNDEYYILDDEIDQVNREIADFGYGLHKASHGPGPGEWYYLTPIEDSERPVDED